MRPLPPFAVIERLRTRAAQYLVVAAQHLVAIARRLRAPLGSGGRTPRAAIAAAHVALSAAMLLPVVGGARTFVTGGDSADQSFCWLEKVFGAIRNGEVVLWDFSTMGGVSFVGEMQTSPLYPVAWLFGLMGAAQHTPHTMDWFLAAHFLLASGGMHVFVRSLGLSHIASFVAAAIFTYGSTFGLRVGGQPNLFASLAWMPWIVLLARSAVRDGRLAGHMASSIAAGVCLALSLLAGHAHATVLAIAAAGLFMLAASFEQAGWKDRLARLSVAGGIMGAVGIGLSLPQLYATREYLQLAYKWYGAGHTEAPHVVPYDVFAKGSLSFADLATIVTGQQVNALDGGTLYFTIAGLALGIVAFAFAGSARDLAGPRRQALLLAILALAFTLPVIWPIGWIAYHMPVLNLVRSPARGLFVFAFAAAVLAAVGVDTLRRVIAETLPAGAMWRGRDPATIVAAVIACVVILEARPWLLSRVALPEGVANAPLNDILHGKTVAKLKELSGPQAPIFRYYASREDVPPNIGNVHPLLSVHGYRSSRTKAFHNYFDFNPASARADALGIRWWITRESIQGLPLIAEIDGRKIYERPSAPPVFWQPHAGGARSDPGIANVSWRSNEVRVAFLAPIEGRVVFAQTEFPGFRATADGIDRPIVLHDGLMAVDLPGPTSVVRIVYAPDWWRGSVNVVVGTAFLALAALTFLLCGLRTR